MCVCVCVCVCLFIYHERFSLKILPESSAAVSEYLQWVPAFPGCIPINAVPAGVDANGMAYSNLHVCAHVHMLMLRVAPILPA